MLNKRIYIQYILTIYFTIFYLGGLSQKIIIPASIDNEVELLIKDAKLEQEVGDFESSAHKYIQAALTCWSELSYGPAIEYFQEAFAIYEQINNLTGMADVSNKLGMIHADIRNYSESINLLEINLRLVKSIGDKKIIISVLLDQALLYNLIKEHTKAIEVIEEALVLSQEINDDLLITNCYALMYETYEKAGNSLKMLYYFRLYLSFHDRTRSNINNSTPITSLPEELSQQESPANISIHRKDLLDRKKALDSAQKELDAIQMELYSLNGTLAEADSFKRKMLLQAKKKELVILNLEQQKRNVALKLEKGRLITNSLTIGIIILIFIIVFFARNYQIKKVLYNEVNAQREKILIQNGELERALEDARAATNAKSQFLSTMSHEIRTPMNSVIGFTNLLRMENPLPRQIKYLDTLHFSANHLLYLINDILDFSKIEAGKLELFNNEFDLSDLLKHVVNTFLLQGNDKGIEVILREIDQVDHLVIGDKIRLSQILTNLMGNGIKFTEQGSVTLDTRIVESHDKKLTIKFSIIDTGIGIYEDNLDNVFNSFTQASSETTRKYGGTGLGLAITKRLVELHGGNIGVKSTVGIGSTFWFTIPFDIGQPLENKEKAPQPVEKDKNKPLKGMRILMAEDNQINIVIAKKFLKMWEVELEVAENGLIAVEKAKSRKFDLILMDLHMPEMDGFEATKVLRNIDDTYFKRLPIVALTANTLNDTQSKIIEYGLNDYVPKPYNPKQLFDVLIKYFV